MPTSEAVIFEAMTVGFLFGCMYGLYAFDFRQFEHDEAVGLNCRYDPLHHYHINFNKKSARGVVRTAQFPSKRIVEICLSDIESVEAAYLGGANSVELCSNRLEGGITPSEGLIEQAVQYFTSLNARSKVEVNVLIRPRAGDFVYSDNEFDVIVRDIKAAKRAGADGIVIGLLTPAGGLDITRLRIVRSIVGQDMSLTFHRAFDVICDAVEDPVSSMQTLISIGFDRLLTSGRGHTCNHGINTLSALVEASQGRISIVACAGIAPDNVEGVVDAARVHGVHSGSAVSSPCSRAAMLVRGAQAVNSDNSDEDSALDSAMGVSAISAVAKDIVNVGLASGSRSNSSVSWDRVDSAKVMALFVAANAAWDRQYSEPSGAGAHGGRTSARNDPSSPALTVDTTELSLDPLGDRGLDTDCSSYTLNTPSPIDEPQQAAIWTGSGSNATLAAPANSTASGMMALNEAIDEDYVNITRDGQGSR